MAISDHDQFEKLLRARHSCVLIRTFEESYVLNLIKNVAAARNADLIVWSADTGLRRPISEPPQVIPDTANPAAALYFLHQQSWRCIAVMLDLAGHLSDEMVLRQLRAGIDHAALNGSAIVLVDHLSRIPPVIEDTGIRMDVSLPDEAEIEQIIIRTLRHERQNGTLAVDIKKSQMDAVIKNLRGLSRRQVEQVVIETVAEDRRFDGGALDDAVGAKRRALGGDGLLEFVKAPASLDEIGGLQKLKHWLAQRQGAFTPQAQTFGLANPRGILILGVQGAGKSLCAKAIATAWQRPLLRLDPGQLYDRYIGESERKLRECLQQAERMSPVVLWIDEIEKGFASAAGTSTDGGLSRRMFGSLLTWMQERTDPVFLVATANDIESLPPELLRKGRFDETFFVDLPGHDARQQIASIHITKRKRDPAKFDLAAIAAATDGYSGAEIEQAIVSAMYDCFEASGELSTDAVIRAATGSPPLSVTMAEKVQALREWADGRTVPAD